MALSRAAPNKQSVDRTVGRSTSGRAEARAADASWGSERNAGKGASRETEDYWSRRQTKDRHLTVTRYETRNRDREEKRAVFFRWMNASAVSTLVVGGRPYCAVALERGVAIVKTRGRAVQPTRRRDWAASLRRLTTAVCVCSLTRFFEPCHATDRGLSTRSHAQLEGLDGLEPPRKSVKCPRPRLKHGLNVHFFSASAHSFSSSRAPMLQ